MCVSLYIYIYPYKLLQWRETYLKVHGALGNSVLATVTTSFMFGVGSWFLRVCCLKLHCEDRQPFVFTGNVTTLGRLSRPLVSILLIGSTSIFWWTSHDFWIYWKYPSKLLLVFSVIPPLFSWLDYRQRWLLLGILIQNATKMSGMVFNILD